MTFVPILPTFPDASSLLAWIVHASAQGAVLVVAVLALRAALGPRLSPGWRLALWLIVGLRLITPVAVESRFSLAGVGRAMLEATRPAPVATPIDPRLPTAAAITVTYGPMPVAASPTRAVAQPTPAPRSIPPLVAIWLAGAAFLVGRQLLAAARLRRDVRAMRRVDDPALLAIAAECARAVGLRRAVPLVETDRLRCPAVCGIVRPAVLLPPGIAGALTRDELRLVLMHEFAHVRRDDVLIGAIAGLIRALHWFNPLAWVAARAFRADRELACDAAVLERLRAGNERRAYGACVLRVVEQVAAARPHPASLGLFGPGRSLRRRIDMIADRSRSTSWLRRVGRTLLGASALVVIGCAAAVGEPSAVAPATSTSTAADAAASGVLLWRVQTASFHDLPIGDAFASAVNSSPAGKAGVTVRMDWEALARAGVTPATRVTASVKEVTLGKTLDVLLAELKRPVDYEVDGKTIVVSTPEGIARAFGVQRAYAVPRLPADANGRAEVLKQVAQLIVDTVDPQSWAGVGPDGRGSVRVDGDHITVSHSRRRQAQVAELLRRIEFDGGTATPAASPPAVDRVQAALDAAMGEAFAVDRLEIEAAIDQFRTAASVPVFVNWNALEAAGIDRNMPVTIRMAAGIKRRKVLSLLLAAAGGGVARLGYVVDDGVVTVSTQDDLAMHVATRTYDIRDLLVTIPDFSSTASTQPAVPTPTREELVEQVTNLITGSVAADSWKVNGGLIGVVQELGGQLIVTQTPDTHAEIAELLKSLRAGRSVQVSVEARLMSVSPAMVPALFGKAGETSAFLDAAAAADVIRRVQQAGDATTLTAPRITLFNGQQAFVKVATPQPYIANFTMTQTAAGERRFEPVVAEAESGVTIDVQATVSADRKFVTLTLGPRVTRLRRLESAPFAGDPAANLTVQRPFFDTQEIRTTVSVPDGGTLLLSGGLTDEAVEGPGPAILSIRPATRPAVRQLLLLVKPTVISQREIDAPEPR